MQKQNQISQIDIANRANENLFQTFYLFGIEPNDLDISDFTKEKKYIEDPYFKQIKLLTKFPPTKKTQYEIDPYIIMNHCFPKGYKFFEGENIPQDEFFFFSLENLNKLNQENRKIYYTCAVIFEPIMPYLKIKYDNKIPSLKKEDNISLDKIYIRKALCFSMVKPFPFESKNLIKELIDYFRSNQITIPLEKLIEGIIFSIPRPLRAYFYISCKKTNEFIPKQKQDIDFRLREFNQYNFSSYIYQLILIFSINDILTIFKCLLLEIPILFFGSTKEILTNVVETFINIIHPLEIQYPHVSILPDSYCGLIETEKSFVFGINHNLRFENKAKDEVNNDDKNKDKDKDKEKNTKKGSPKYFKEHLLNVENKLILICDVDRRKIHQNETLKNMFHVVKLEDLGIYQEGLPNSQDNIQLESKDIFSYSSSEDLDTNLPEKITNKLVKEVSTYALQNSAKDKKNTEGTIQSKKYSAEFNKKIGEDFFYNYLTNIFNNYFNYMYNDEENVKKIIANEILNKREEDINIENLFNINQYLHDNKNDSEFYSRFFKTRIFKNFIIRKYLNEPRDKFEFLRFDEKILEKRSKGFFSKKIKLEFSSSKIFEFSHIYQIKNANNFMESEMSYIRSHKNDFLKNYFQTMGQYNKIKYTIFPKLIYDNKFFSNKEYKPNVEFSANIVGCMKGYNSINNVIRDEPNPYNFFNIYKKNIIRYLPEVNKIDIKNEVQNSLNKVWVYMFCLTFYYCDENEKNYRFEELIKFLPRVVDEKRELIPLLLLTMDKYGDENMSIKVFESFKHITYIEYCVFCHKFKGEIGKKFELKKLDTTNTNLNISYFRANANEVEAENEEKNSSNKITLKTNDNKTIRKKIFTLKKNVYKKKIAFEMSYKCQFCGQLNETTDLAVNLINKLKSGLMLCHKCQKYNEPKINIVSGKDKFEFNIFSPIKLLNIAREIAAEYGDKIDLDELREKYSSFYWSCIFYFYLNGFNFEILMVYKTKEMKISSETKNKVLKFKNLKLDKQYK